MSAKTRSMVALVALCNVIGFSAIGTGKTVMAFAAEGEENPSSLSVDESSSEEIESSSEESSSEEAEISSSEEAVPDNPSNDDDYWKAIEDYITALEKQIKDLSETKFLNGTIGGLISSALTLLVYAIFKVAERKGFKSRTELFSRANGLLNQVQGKVDDLHKTESLSEEQYKIATKAIESATNLLSDTNNRLDETDKAVAETKEHLTELYQSSMEEMAREYKELLSKYQILIEMFKEMAKSSPDMVKSGAYAKLTEIENKGE